MDLTVYTASFGEMLLGSASLALRLIPLAIVADLVTYLIMPRRRKVKPSFQVPATPPPDEPEELMMYQPVLNGNHCESCGRMNPSEAQYCIQCGEKLV